MTIERLLAEDGTGHASNGAPTKWTPWFGQAPIANGMNLAAQPTMLAKRNGENRVHDLPVVF